VPIPADFAAAREFSKYERTRIRQHLATFHDKQLIVDVVHRVKAGKEATVYTCTGHPSTGRSVIAAKLYREQSLRGSKNTGEYEEGRATLGQSDRARTSRAPRQQKGHAGAERRGLCHPDLVAHA
jgi:serine/threonine-protein kinase RIO1